MDTQYSPSQAATIIAAAAFAVNQHINDNFPTLSHEEISDLNDQARTLLLKARTLSELATIEIAADTAEALQSLKDASDDIQSAITTIKNVQKVIDITAKLVTLATSVIGADLAAIPDNVKDIIDSL